MLAAFALMGLVFESQTSAPLQTVEVNATARNVRAFRAKDEFDTPPSQRSVAGRPFSLDVPPLGSGGRLAACFGYPMWSYSAETGTLYVSTGESDLMLNSFLSKQGAVSKRARSDIWGEKIQYFATDCARADLPNYTATNAYGAEFHIEPTLQTVTAIADALPRGQKWPDSFRMQIPGSEARTLVPRLRVRFIGVMQDWKPGVAVACGTRRDGPTSSSPYDRRMDLCLFNARIDRIELRNATTGELMDAFSRPTE